MVSSFGVTKETGDVILVGTNGQWVFRSSDNGDHWVNVHNGLTSSNVHSLLITPGSSHDTYAATTDGVFHSSDLGDSWTRLSSLQTNTFYPIVSVVPDPSASGGARLYVGDAFGTLHSSTDKGLTWSQNVIASATCTVRSVEVISLNTQDTLLLSSSEGAYRSNDGGLTWQLSTEGNWHDLGYSNSLLSGINSFAVVSDTLFAARGTLIRSTDDGESWSVVQPEIINVLACEHLGKTYLVGGGRGSVSVSTDGGGTWNYQRFTISPNAVVYSLLAASKNGKTLLFAGTQGAGVFQSTDMGETWTDISEGLHDRIVSSLAVVGSYLFAGTRDWGVWRRPLSEITGMDTEPAAMPSDITLEQNYPNPFHSQTDVQFHIPARAFVSLSIYNVVGSKVANLVCSSLSPGTHVSRWDATGLPNGPYFCRLTVNNTVVTKKLTLINQSPIVFR